MTSGINGRCDCPLGRAHALDCHNYIEVELPCPVCSTKYGRHAKGCLMARPRKPVDLGARNG